MKSEDFFPCNIYEYKDKFDLELNEFNVLFSDLVAKNSGQGGGYSMQSMVRAALKIEGLNFHEIEFDSEGDAFHVRGEASSLVIISKIVRKILNNEKYAINCILEAKKNRTFE